MPAHDCQNHRPVRAVFGRSDVAEFGRRQAAGGRQQFSPLPPPAAFESVHLADFPTGDPAAIDEQLSLQMNLVREIASLGLAARMGAKLKVRQPLAQG